MHHFRDWYSRAAVDFGWYAALGGRIPALAGCAARGGRIPAVVFDRRATKHPAKIRAALRVGAAPAPRRVAGSLNRTSAIRLASALRVIRRRSQRCYTSLRLGALDTLLERFVSDDVRAAARCHGPCLRDTNAECAIALLPSKVSEVWKGLMNPSR